MAAKRLKIEMANNIVVSTEYCVRQKGDKYLVFRTKAILIQKQQPLVIDHY